MQPIHELLNRIQWDPEFGEGYFELGILDKVENKIIRLPLNQVVLVSGDHFFFHYMDAEGIEHDVPFHRIKSVYKNGELIWHREH